MSRDTRRDIRDNIWWQKRALILGTWINEALAGSTPGFVLKTDLYDEAGGPFHHARLPDAGLKFLGIDHDFRIVSAAKERLLSAGLASEIVVADVRSLPFRTGSLSAVLSLSTLDHFDDKADIEGSLVEIERILNVGGSLLLTMDNPLNPEVWLRAIIPAFIVRALRSDKFPLGVTLPAGKVSRLIRRSGMAIQAQSTHIHALRYLSLRLARLLGDNFTHFAARLLGAYIMGAEKWTVAPLRRFTGHYNSWTVRKPA